MDKFKCPVCGQRLIKQDKSYKCKLNHSYDIAKKGYTNFLLANQGQHFVEEGDKKEMIDARARFLNSNKYKCLLDMLIFIIKGFVSSENPYYFCDVACGEGYYTTAIHQELSKQCKFNTIGVDISKSAINSCSTRKNILHLSDIEYCIGNLDYLPFLDKSFDSILNCFAPINEKEFLRILKKDGYYIRVLPGTYHLYELKEFLYPTVHLNIPKEDDMTGFTLVSNYEVNDIIELDNQEIQDLFTMTPYYYKTSIDAKEKLKNLNYLKTKISFIILVYQKK